MSAGMDHPPPPFTYSQAQGHPTYGHSPAPGPSTGLGSFDPLTGAPSDSADRIDRIQRLLAKKLGPEYLSSRQGGGGSKLTYIEGWRVISLANEIFGFNGWFTEVKRLDTDFIDFHTDTSRYSMGVTAIVRVWLKDGASHEDVGYGKAENVKSKAEGLDKCKKEAVTDALKRTLRNFGSLLGNCLYDKGYLAEVAKMKAPKSKFNWSELHRPDDLPPERAPPPPAAPTTSTTISPAPVPALVPAPVLARGPAPPRPPPPAKAAHPRPPTHTVTTRSPVRAKPLSDPIDRSATATADLFDADADALFANIDMGSEYGNDSGFVELVPPASDAKPAAATKTPLQVEQARQRAEFLLRHRAQQDHHQKQAAGGAVGVEAGVQRQQSAPVGGTTTTAAQLVSGAVAATPFRGAQQHQRSNTVAQPPVAAATAGLRRAVPPARTAVTSAYSVNPSISRPVHRGATTAGQLPSLTVGSAAGRLGGGVASLVTRAAGSDGSGCEMFVSARGVKRGPDGYDPTPPTVVPTAGANRNIAPDLASPRQPLEELEVDVAGEVKRTRLA